MVGFTTLPMFLFVSVKVYFWAVGGPRARSRQEFVGQRVSDLTAQIDQWPFQEPKLEVPTYVREYPRKKKGQKYGTVPPF